jgi:hypothetical protein
MYEYEPLAPGLIGWNLMNEYSYVTQILIKMKIMVIILDISLISFPIQLLHSFKGEYH